MAICGRTRELVDRATTELKQSPGGDVFGHPADVSNSDQVASLFEAVASRFGGLDILVNNAGAGVFRGVQDLTLQDWRDTIDLNLSGVSRRQPTLCDTGQHNPTGRPPES